MIKHTNKYYIYITNIIFLITLTILIFGGRWYSMLYPFILNPDEALMGANALRAKIHGYNWDAVDGTTSGPLNSVILLWPNIFGLDTTLSFIRLTASILLFFICIFLYKTIKANSSQYYAITFTLPIVCFYSFARDPDFLHYSSEIFPVFLLIIANYYILNINNYNINDFKKKGLYFFIGLLLGIVPFIKLQSTIIAMFMGLYGLYLSFNKSNLKNTGFFIIGGLTPAIIILLPLFLNGNINHFWLSYIGMANDYVKKPLTILSFYEMVVKDSILENVINFYIGCFLFSFINLTILIYKNKLNKLNENKFKITYLTILIIIIIWTIAKPGKAYPHYLMFLPPFLAVFVSVTIFNINKTLINKNKFFINFTYCILFIIFLIISISSTNDVRSYYKKYKTPIKQYFRTKNPELLSWLPIENGHLVVWGFMPQLYIGTNMTPATRETFTHYQTVQNSLSYYYRPRFIDDIVRSNLDVVIDSAHGNSFRFKNPNIHSVRVFPDFSLYLDKNFSRLSPYVENINCPEIYVRNKYKATLDQTMVIPKNIEATQSYSKIHSANNLLDLSTTEETCIDYWLLPDATLGSLTITLFKVENISKLMILNTKNSSSVNRSSKDLTIKFFNNDQLVATKKIKANDHPYWSNLTFASPIFSNKISVEVGSYSGTGGGLNEIKIFRSIK